MNELGLRVGNEIRTVQTRRSSTHGTATFRDILQKHCSEEEGKKELSDLRLVNE
jgi:hypothetical protein